MNKKWLWYSKQCLLLPFLLLLSRLLFLLFVIVVIVLLVFLGVNGICGIHNNACYPWFVAVILQVALCMYKRKISIREDLFSQIFSMPPHLVDTLFVFCILYSSILYFCIFVIHNWDTLNPWPLRQAFCIANKKGWISMWSWLIRRSMAALLLLLFWKPLDLICSKVCVIPKFSYLLHTKCFQTKGNVTQRCVPPKTNIKRNLVSPEYFWPMMISQFKIYQRQMFPCVNLDMVLHRKTWHIILIFRFYVL